MGTGASASEAEALRFYSSLGTAGMRDTFDRFAGSIHPSEVLEHVTGHAPVLDLGCGTGRVALGLARHGIECIGLDIVDEFVADANATAVAETLNARFVVGGMLSLPFDDCAFGSVICVWSTFNSLLTPDEQIRALVEAHRVLVPGGVLFLDLMSAGAEPAGSRADCRVLSSECQLYRHSAATISRVCAASQFKIDSVTEPVAGRIHVLGSRRER